MPHVPGRNEVTPFWASAPRQRVFGKRQVPVIMYAIIETGGKQYKVQNGDVIYIEKLDAEAEETVTFDKVVALHTGKSLKLGAPYVKGATVEARVLKNGKARKITVFTYKPKKGSSRKMGHRQPYTKVEIDVIQAKPKKTDDAAAEN